MFWYSLNALRGSHDTKRRISHLRVPFCLAYSKAPIRYRDGKHAPQAEACMHLGYSRTKAGYVLEIIDGPRAGQVITSNQVKFRESLMPCRQHLTPQPTPQPAELLWEDIQQDDDITHVPDKNDDDDDES